MVKECKGLRREVHDYEGKYKFIDIDKMHEKVQFLTTKLEVSDKKCRNLEVNLFELREKIMRAT